MRYKTLEEYLPKSANKILFGDRELHGTNIQHDDVDWNKWQKLYMDFYSNTQKKGIGKAVNDAGYGILREVSFEQKKVMEIGPGLLPHYKFWKGGGGPDLYYVVDVKEEFAKQSGEILRAFNIEAREHIIHSAEIPLENNSMDIVLSFYNLEHLNPLSIYLDEIKRILRPGGLLVGAIPCEGGLAWGLGRFLTTRRYVNNKGINYDKVICWEHPNFANFIIEEIEKRFVLMSNAFWPACISNIDINLVYKFIYKK